MSILTFGKGNAKLGKNVYTFSLPSGFTCPSALECLSKANKETGKIVDGPHTQFRCFSASQEALYKNVRTSRWNNFEQLKVAKTTNRMFDLIQSSIPRKADIIRIHVAGDFFNQTYFDAWEMTANATPKTLFYFYTKSIQFWLERLDKVGNGHSEGMTKNFVPTASYGGKHDKLILEYGMRYTKVVYSEQEAKDSQLEIDHDDTHAMNHGDSFALLIHGTQPKGSDASVALQKLKLIGLGGYSKGKKNA